MTPRDIASASSSCRTLRVALAIAPLRIQVCHLMALLEDRVRSQVFLKKFCSLYSGTSHIDASGLPLEDSDVLELFDQLPNLLSLELSGCRKLTHALTQSLPVNKSKLSTLAMQRCFQLQPKSLDTFLWSTLECLALSHLNLVEWPSQSIQTMNVSRLKYLALHNCSNIGGCVLSSLANHAPELEHLFLGGCQVTPIFESSAHTMYPTKMRSWVVSAVERTLEVFGKKSSTPISFLREIAVELGCMLAMLRELTVLELSFWPQGLLPLLTLLLESENIVSTRSKQLQIWNMCSAQGLLQASKRKDRHPEVDVCLRAAARCSSPSRQTPLHVSAEEGICANISLLLKMGSCIDARDKSGATPLFLACEVGNASVAKLLLENGASATQRNTAGEAPLYIAALRGHSVCVDVLLKHCHEHGIAWQDPKLYGDQWTPLMAAAVGGRAEIAAQLIAAAGSDAAVLVAAVNRYGQNALHIAARKGTEKFLKTLLEAGDALSLVLAADVEGHTAAEVAMRNNNPIAWRVLNGAREVARLGKQNWKATAPKTEKRAVGHQMTMSGNGRWVGKRLQQRRRENR